MSHASLAARYRPQTFAEVTGQTMVKTILSRAAAQDKVAPAYLLSGTRGVGKTTIARIFAKALNCEHAPTAEPCNACEQCRRITQGNHVDVVEIDGASNTGVDDARRLKETIGYAPMEGRYKVFIIDEAHMLSRNAFNALLKTLEEPPPRAIFILATTEPHKFPPTIISRCQHFAFQAQPESELVEHLRRVLDKEVIPYEESALRLIARRAAGSIRDGMSLLGQTLALGGDALNEAVARDVLGVAGQEAYERLLAAIQAQDCLAVAVLCRELLERGVDIGFFLRELAGLWRNLFLIRQVGERAAAALDLPEAEQQRLAALAPGFELTFIHAAWQMVLESQRQVLTSLEPAAALELLLLNLAILPRLVSLEALSTVARQDGRTGGAAQTPAPQAPRPTQAPAPRPAHASTQVRPAPERFAQAHPTQTATAPDRVPHMEEHESRPAVQAVQPAAAPHISQPVQPDLAVQAMPPEPPIPARQQTEPPAPAAQQGGTVAPDWNAFLAFCGDNASLRGPLSVGQLRQAQGVFDAAGLTLHTIADMQETQFSTPEYAEALRRLVTAYCGHPVKVRVLPPATPVCTEADLKLQMAERPEVKAVAQTFDAQILRCISAPATPTTLTPSEEN